jgi:VIT1/CCC1 family predicted Fe2+/Mn2+ transporter
MRPAVFGSFDGLTAILGVLLSLSHQPRLILPAALGLAVAEGVGMCAGEWLSDSDSGFGAAAVIGLATAAGSILPAFPYALLPRGMAVAVSVAVFALMGTAISAARARERGWVRSLIETFGVLVVALVAVVVCELLTPGGAG